MGIKKRFGVSLDSELLDGIDRVARALNTTRSAVIEEAVRAFLADYNHLIEKHVCCGIIIVEGVGEGIRDVVERFRDVVLNHMHLHAGCNCFDMLLVHGDSSRIAELESVLVKELRCATRFVPLSTIHRRPGRDGRASQRG